MRLHDEFTPRGKFAPRGKLMHINGVLEYKPGGHMTMTWMRRCLNVANPLRFYSSKYSTRACQ